MAAVPSVGRSSFAGGPARAPQAAATAGLYERHAPKILSYCLHQLGSREEAEDAVQTTFMNAFRALGRGVVPEAESAWLFKIAENVCLSRRRSSWRRGRIESPSDFEVIEEVVPGPSRQRDELIGIQDALASMPEQQRRAILLREWQGLSYREISDELELSQSAVETLIFRARRSLAQGLEQPELVKKPRRRAFRRALHMVDLGTIAAAAKTLLAGSAAAKATVAAVAVTAAAGAAGVTPKFEGHSPKPAAPPARVTPAPLPDVAVTVAAPAAVRPAFTGLDARAVPTEPAPVRATRVDTRRAGTPASIPVAATVPAQTPVAAPPDEGAPAAAPGEPVRPVAEAPTPSPAPVDQPKQAQPTPTEAASPAAPADDAKIKQRGEPGPRGGKPAAVITPAPVVGDAGAAKDREEKERGQDRKRRDLAAALVEAPTSLKGVEETVPAAPTPAAPTAEPTVDSASEPTSTAAASEDNGKGARRTK